MLEKLKKVEEKFDFISAELCKSEVVSDMELYKKYMQELKHLSPIVEKYREYKAAENNAEEAKSLLEESGADLELKELARAELEEAKENIERTQQELKVLLLPRDPNDDRNVIVEIRGGAGGEEAALFAGVLFRMYSMYGDTKGFKTEVLDYLDGDEAGIKSVTIQINGENAFGYLKSERGVHRLVRISPFNAAGKRQTSFVSCDVMPDIEEDLDVDINPDDLRIDTYRSSGAGGQHINKTSSAIRITHLPTGIVVQCQNERSQFQNKDKAMQMLKAKLYMLKQQENAEKLSDIRGEVMENGWGSQIRSYVLQPYTMVKDLRTGEETGNVSAVLDGELDPFISAYLRWLSLGCPDRRTASED